MSSSPKITEYIGRIAPKDKVGLYMGCSFLPAAGGNLFAGILSGQVYQSLSDKISLLKREVASQGITIPEIVPKIAETGKTFSQNDYVAKAAELMNLTNSELTQMLWDKYYPSKIWLLFTGIGAATAILLLLYDRFILVDKKPGEE